MSDDKDFLNDLLARTAHIEEAPEGKQFEHSYLRADPENVVKVLANMRIENLPFYKGIFPDAANPPPQERLFVSSHDGGVLIWHERHNLRVPQHIAAQLSCRWDWVSVYEDLRFWAYIGFQGSVQTDFIIDPESFWIDNIVRGPDLAGEGPRRFPNLQDFLQEISTAYQPVDEQWDFDKLLVAGSHGAKQAGFSCVEIGLAPDRLVLPYGAQRHDSTFELCKRHLLT